MSDYSNFDSGEPERVPLKLMLFVGVIAVLGAVFFLIALAIDRKPLDPNIDPSRPEAFEQTDADLEETPDLWVAKKPLPPPDMPFGTTPLKNPLAKPRDTKSILKGDEKPTSKPS